MLPWAYASSRHSNQAWLGVSWVVRRVRRRSAPFILRLSAPSGSCLLLAPASRVPGACPLPLIPVHPRVLHPCLHRRLGLGVTRPLPGVHVPYSLPQRHERRLLSGQVSGEVQEEG